MRHRMTIAVGIAAVLGVGADAFPWERAVAQSAESVTLLAQARSQSPGAPGSQGIAPTMPGSGPPKPLAGPMGLEPGNLPGVHVAPPTAAEMAQLNDEMKTAHLLPPTLSAKSAAMLNVQKACKAKTYAVEEQKAAGCQPMDNVATCSIKLYKHCMATSFDLARFQKFAKEELERAEKLQTLVKKYQTRIHDALKAFTP
jgi:hypothetical protein